MRKVCFYNEGNKDGNMDAQSCRALEKGGDLGGRVCALGDGEVQDRMKSPIGQSAIRHVTSSRSSCQVFCTTHLHYTYIISEDDLDKP